METKVWAIRPLNYSWQLDGQLPPRSIKSSQGALVYLQQDRRSGLSYLSLYSHVETLPYFFSLYGYQIYILRQQFLAY